LADAILVLNPEHEESGVILYYRTILKAKLKKEE
jgi:hypothetical protein